MTLSNIQYPSEGTPTESISFTGEDKYSTVRTSEHITQIGENDSSGDAKVISNERTKLKLTINGQMHTDVSSSADEKYWELDSFYASHAADDVRLIVQLGAVAKTFVGRISKLAQDRRTGTTAEVKFVLELLVATVVS